MFLSVSRLGGSDWEKIYDEFFFWRAPVANKNENPPHFPVVLPSGSFDSQTAA